MSPGPNSFPKATGYPEDLPEDHIRSEDRSWDRVTSPNRAQFGGKGPHGDSMTSPNPNSIWVGKATWPM